MGRIDSGFHFLGIHYPWTRTQDNTKGTHSVEDGAQFSCGHNLKSQQQNVPSAIVPHSRALRKGRIQVQQMVTDGFSTSAIVSYLNRFIHWWVRTSATWDYAELLKWFIDACWDPEVSKHARRLLDNRVDIIKLLL
jgi:hypothetical protein